MFMVSRKAKSAKDIALRQAMAEAAEGLEVAVLTGCIPSHSCRKVGRKCSVV
jgi:hypothetical protein